MGERYEILTQPGQKADEQSNEQKQVVRADFEREKAPAY
jgi:hypothetical protein